MKFLNVVLVSGCLLLSAAANAEESVQGAGIDGESLYRCYGLLSTIQGG